MIHRHTPKPAEVLVLILIAAFLATWLGIASFVMPILGMLLASVILWWIVLWILH